MLALQNKRRNKSVVNYITLHVFSYKNNIASIAESLAMIHDEYMMYMYMVCINLNHVGIAFVWLSFIYTVYIAVGHIGWGGGEGGGEGGGGEEGREKGGREEVQKFMTWSICYVLQAESHVVYRQYVNNSHSQWIATHQCL